jgi:diacylglycerol kinase (ATP)
VKARLIVNPSSGTESAPDHLLLMNQLLRERLGSLDVVITSGEGDGITEGRRAAEEGYDRLFVAGGDGTLNEVLNGVASVPGGLAQITFGVIPLGTGNDFATALGIPADAEAAIHTLLDGEALPVDVGTLNGRHFVNVSAGGFIAEVSDAVHPQLKTIAGKLAYLLGGAQVLLDYSPVGAELREADASSGDGNTPRKLPASVLLHAFAVCNSRLVGGGRLIAPGARIDDGLLDVCLIQAMPTLEFIALLRRVSEGEHLDDERVTYERTSALEMSFDRTIKVNVDGQVLETDRCSYQVLRHATRFLATKTAVTASQK